jgi:hypothetical protein
MDTVAPSSTMFVPKPWRTFETEAMGMRGAGKGTRGGGRPD